MKRIVMLLALTMLVGIGIMSCGSTKGNISKAKAITEARDAAAQEKAEATSEAETTDTAENPNIDPK